jgi:hypothetical protein
MQAALHELEIVRVFKELRAAGIEPILVKGWSIARLYPDSGLRPYDDLDLIVDDKDHAKAVEITAPRQEKQESVDIHSVSQLDRDSFDRLFDRSHLVRLEDSEIRVLSPEDHLRILCIHLLKHGAFRPLWLCDVAVAVENRPANFDWKICLGDDPRRAKWVTSAIGVAHQLLGARIEGTPIMEEAQKLPKWLVPGVLKQWERPRGIDHAPDKLVILTLRRPLDVPRALVMRWRDPIRATICVEGSFSATPRIIYQVEDYCSQLAKFLVRFPSLLKQQNNN